VCVCARTRACVRAHRVNCTEHSPSPCCFEDKRITSFHRAYIAFCTRTRAHSPTHTHTRAHTRTPHTSLTLNSAASSPFKLKHSLPSPQPNAPSPATFQTPSQWSPPLSQAALPAAIVTRSIATRSATTGGRAGGVTGLRLVRRGGGASRPDKLNCRWRWVGCGSVLGVCVQFHGCSCAGGALARAHTRMHAHATCVTRHTSHVTRHASHVTRHTSHVTRHTSHVTKVHAVDQLLREAGGVTAVRQFLPPPCFCDNSLPSMCFCDNLRAHAPTGMGLTRSRSVHISLTRHKQSHDASFSIARQTHAFAQVFARAKSVLQRAVSVTCDV
jgi:hypothetical protein